MIEPLDRSQVEQLLFKEMRFLDERRYEDWIALYTQDATYWIPSWDSELETVDNISTDLSYLFLKRSDLEDYVVRVRSGEAHVLEPAPRVSRIVTNVLISDTEENTVYCKWILHLFRRGFQDWFSGDARYSLRWENGQLKVAAKKSTVINNLFEHGHFII